MLRWLGWPIKTPTGDALRTWLADLAAADAKRETANAGPERDDATGFGPEAFDQDPTENTKMIT
jgi:hypothetical protein